MNWPCYRKLLAVYDDQILTVSGPQFPDCREFTGNIVSSESVPHLSGKNCCANSAS